jgi:predicted signal transduction protein with EAL and GGDEF domain
VLPGWTSSEVQLAAERLRTCVSNEPFSVNGHALEVSISIGLARCESPTDQPEDIVARADAALYEAKRAGRNRVAYAMGTHNPDTESSGSRRYLRQFFEKIRREAEKRGEETQ